MCGLGSHIEESEFYPKILKNYKQENDMIKCVFRIFLRQLQRVGWQRVGEDEEERLGRHLSNQDMR